MRIDLFLKKSGLLKRRKIAHDLCIGGSIEINNKQAKPSKDVKAGDIVKIASSEKFTKIKVIDPEEGKFQIIEG